MIKWTSRTMSMHIYWKNPLYVSRGLEQDVIEMKVMDHAKSLFVSKETFRELNGTQVLQVPLVNQLPNSMEEGKLI